MGLLSFLFGVTGITALSLAVVVAIIRCVGPARTGAAKPAGPPTAAPKPITPSQVADVAAAGAAEVDDGQPRRRRHIRRLND